MADVGPVTETNKAADDCPRCGLPLYRDGYTVGALVSNRVGQTVHGSCMTAEDYAQSPVTSEAPRWWPPQAGDVAFYEDCVEGGDPYRVVVSYRHDERSWMNVASGIVFTTPIWPGRLVLLVRDGCVIPGATP